MSFIKNLFKKSEGKDKLSDASRGQTNITSAASVRKAPATTPAAAAASTSTTSSTTNRESKRSNPWSTILSKAVAATTTNEAELIKQSAATKIQRFYRAKLAKKQADEEQSWKVRLFVSI